MSLIYSYPCTTLSGQPAKITISTGPVIVSHSWDKVLLHISETTGKYQFIGGKYDDTLNFRENALERAHEVVGDNQITLSEEDPLVIKGTIERDGHDESIILVHYRGVISDEVMVGNADWFTREEVTMLDAENKTSSENIRIATDHFLAR